MCTAGSKHRRAKETFGQLEPKNQEISRPRLVWKEWQSIRNETRNEMHEATDQRLARENSLCLKTATSSNRQVANKTDGIVTVHK